MCRNLVLERSSMEPIVTNFALPAVSSNFKYVGIDRDDTLIEDAGNSKLNHEPKWLPGVIKGLKLINSLNLGVVIFTNQSGLSKGLFNQFQLENFHRRINNSLINQAGFGLNGIIVCPHLSIQKCLCRKPLPGMFHVAQKIYGKLPEVMIGDSEKDMQAAKLAGVFAIKIERKDFLDKIENWLAKL